MAHTEKCPICKGKGVVYKPPKTIIDTFASLFVLRFFFEETCHGCGGKGWVEIQGQQQGYWPWPTFDSGLITEDDIAFSTFPDHETSTGV